MTRLSVLIPLLFIIATTTSTGQLQQGSESPEGLHELLAILSRDTGFVADFSVHRKPFFSRDTHTTRYRVHGYADGDEFLLLIEADQSSVGFVDGSSFVASHSDGVVTEVRDNRDSLLQLWHDGLLQPYLSHGESAKRHLSSGYRASKYREGDKYYNVLEASKALDGFGGEVDSQSVRYVFNPRDGILSLVNSTFYGFESETQYASTRIDSLELISSDSVRNKLRFWRDSITDRYVWSLPSTDEFEIFGNVLAPGNELDGELLAAVDSTLRANGSDLRTGQLILLDFWYAACFPCRSGLRSLAQLRDSLADHNIAIIGVNPVDQPGPEIERSTLIPLGVNFPQYFCDSNLIERLELRAFPFQLLVRADDGVILERWVGSASDHWHLLQDHL